MTGCEVGLIVVILGKGLEKYGDTGDIIKIMNEQIYDVLTMKSHGTALKLVKTLKKNERMNGIIGWHRFFFEARGYAAQRAQGLATRVYKPNRVHK